MFDCDKWNDAFAAAGLDVDYFASRERKDDEPFPWEHMDSGVARGYLLNEWKKAHDTELTRDCRRERCTGCGVCPNLNVHIVDLKEGNGYGKTTFSY